MCILAQNSLIFARFAQMRFNWVVRSLEEKYHTKLILGKDLKPQANSKHSILPYSPMPVCLRERKNKYFCHKKQRYNHKYFISREKVSIEFKLRANLETFSILQANVYVLWSWWIRYWTYNPYSKHFHVVFNYLVFPTVVHCLCHINHPIAVLVSIFERLINLSCSKVFSSCLQ